MEQALDYDEIRAMVARAKEKGWIKETRVNLLTKVITKEPKSRAKEKLNKLVQWKCSECGYTIESHYCLNRCRQCDTLGSFVRITET